MRKPRTKQEMIDYLSGHFLYHTAGSWNRATSYAVNIKARSIDLPKGADRNRVYELLEVETSWDESGFNEILQDFGVRHYHSYQIGTNGRSGGYLVLYQGGAKPSQHKSVCRNCGQRNFQSVENEPGQCGRCQKMARYNATFPPETFTYPGKGFDMDEDYSTWSTADLKSRVELVWDFDQTCARAVRAYIDFAMACTVEEETVMVPHKYKVAVCK